MDDDNDTRLPSHTQVRNDDPDTSHEAATKLKDLSKKQARVMAIHRDNPAAGLTDHELLERWLLLYGPVPESTPRKRRCDCTRLGLLADSKTRRLINGRNRIVWILA